MLVGVELTAAVGVVGFVIGVSGAGVAAAVDAAVGFVPVDQRLCSEGVAVADDEGDYCEH